MKGVDAKYIEMLKNYDSPTISNVIELFEIRPQTTGYLHSSIKALFPELPPMVGHAVTMTFQASKKSEGKSQYNDIGRHVEALCEMPEPRVWVVQDMDEEPVGASFGELVVSTYMAFGCVGIVSSGGARDSVAIRKRKLPIFAPSNIVSHGYPHCLALNVPVEVGGVTIKPGDLLHGDADGIVTVPGDLAPQIAIMCQRFMEAEKKWIDYVDSPNPAVEGVRGAVEEYKNFQAQAKKEIRRNIIKK